MGTENVFSQGFDPGLFGYSSNELQRRYRDIEHLSADKLLERLSPAWRTVLSKRLRRWGNLGPALVRNAPQIVRLGSATIARGLRNRASGHISGIAGTK